MGSRRLKKTVELRKEQNDLPFLPLVLLPVSLLIILCPPTLLCYHALGNEQTGTQGSSCHLLCSYVFGLLCQEIPEEITPLTISIIGHASQQLSVFFYSMIQLYDHFQSLIHVLNIKAFDSDVLFSLIMFVQISAKILFSPFQNRYN